LLRARRERAQERLEAFGFADDFSTREAASLTQLGRTQGRIAAQD
jgi:hypothetical protein